MMDVWVVLFPYKTGIYEKLSSLEYIMETTGLKYVKKDQKRGYCQRIYTEAVLFGSPVFNGD